MFMESMDGNCDMDMSQETKRRLSARDKEILALWKTGLTGRQIAEKLGMTRGAILGLVNRLRIAGYVKYRAKNPRPKRDAPRKAQKPPEKNLDRFELSVSAAPPLIPEPVQTRPLTIMELGRRSCRFILNDGKPSSFLFCGKTTDKGSYCLEHHKVCFTNIEKSGKPFMMNNKLTSSIR